MSGRQVGFYIDEEIEKCINKDYAKSVKKFVRENGRHPSGKDVNKSRIVQKIFREHYKKRGMLK